MLTLDECQKALELEAQAVMLKRLIEKLPTLTQDRKSVV